MAVFQGFSFICIYHDLYKMVSKWCQNLPGVSRGAGQIIYCAVLPFRGYGAVLSQIYLNSIIFQAESTQCFNLNWVLLSFLNNPHAVFSTNNESSLLSCLNTFHKIHHSLDVLIRKAHALYALCGFFYFCPQDIL